MRKLLIVLFSLIATPSFAACPDVFDLASPKQHEVLGCDVKPLSAHHFTAYDASHQAINLRKEGDYLNIQFKYTGDWLITPTRIQLVPYYLDQIRKFDGKLVYENENLATYRFYRDDKTYWMELRFVGDGIHVIRTIEQVGIVLDAQYSVPQIKSRIKRYGKVVFYGLSQNTASQQAVATFLAVDERDYYIVGHAYNVDDPDSVSTMQAQDIYRKLIVFGVNEQQILSKGVGAASPIKNPLGVNSAQKNTRIELVLRVKMP